MKVSGLRHFFLPNQDADPAKPEPQPKAEPAPQSVPMPPRAEKGPLAAVAPKPSGGELPPGGDDRTSASPAQPLSRVPHEAAGGVAAQPPGTPPASAASAFKARDLSLYKNLLGGLYDGVVILDAKGSVIASNRRAEQFLGYSEQGLWGVQCENLIAGINVRMLHKLHANAEEGRFTVVNGTCKRKDGTSFPAEIAINRIHLFNEGDLIFSIRSIERREKVREQRGLEEQAVLDTGAGMVVCSLEGAIEFANPAFLKLLNLAEEQEVLKHFIGDFCASCEQTQAMMHAPSSPGMWLGSLELVTSKGAKRMVLVTAALSRMHRGGVARLVLTMIPLPQAVR